MCRISRGETAEDENVVIIRFHSEKRDAESNSVSLQQLIFLRQLSER